MTEAGWTADKPNASGWYWNRINGTVGIALIMRRDCQLYAWLRFKDAWLSREGWLDYIHGEWLGPITPDSYQQGRVAGLREAAEMVEDDCYIEGGELLPDYKHRCKHNVNQKELAGKIRFRANDLAQQAQEGGVGDGKAVGNETA